MLCAILFRLLAFAIANAFDTKNGLEATLPSRLALFLLKNKATYSKKNNNNYSIESKYSGDNKYNKKFPFRSDTQVHRHHRVGKSIEKCLLQINAEGIFLLDYRIIKFVLFRII